VFQFESPIFGESLLVGVPSAPGANAMSRLASDVDHLIAQKRPTAYVSHRS